MAEDDVSIEDMKWPDRFLIKFLFSRDWHRSVRVGLQLIEMLLQPFFCLVPGLPLCQTSRRVTLLNVILCATP